MEELSVIRSINKRAMVAGVLFSMAISGCSANDTRDVEVDGHVFHVPVKHLVKGKIPWLPASQSAGLTFIINPDSPPEEQMIVGIESTEVRCHPKTPPVSNQLASACAAAARKGGSDMSEQGFTLERVHRNEDPTQWEYRLKGPDENDQGTIVASCSALSDDGKTGLCTSLSNYKDLVYSVGLRDSDVQRLPDIWKQVHKMLASWEG